LNVLKHNKSAVQLTYVQTDLSIWLHQQILSTSYCMNAHPSQVAKTLSSR